MQPKHDRDAAVLCAEAFLRLAEPIVIRIGKNVPESTTQSRPFLPSMGDVAAAATNLAFSIELYIKAILIASKIEAPMGRAGHNLGKLYAAIPSHFKDVLERSYEETRKKDWNGKYPSITVALRPDPANLPKWDDIRSQSLGLGPLLDRSSDIFSSWRYIYEFNLGEGGWKSHRFEYGLLLSACHAMRDTIKPLQNTQNELTSTA